MTREEWDQAGPDNRPGIRFCVTVTSPEDRIVSTAVTKPCEWCGTLVWVDEAQELPAFGREIGVIPICENCALAHPTIGPAILKNMLDVYLHWERTGVVKAVLIED
jgi:hypothetical protein